MIEPATQLDPYTSLREQARMLAAKEISAVELVTAHLERIERINPTVNAVVTLTPERALEEARRVDEVRARSAAGQGKVTTTSAKEIPPLAGIPMTHKDTHELAGMRTTWGSPIFAHHTSTRTDLIIERLRAAGVISTGKNNVPEFAAGAHTFNPVFGTTLNPYDTSKSAGGSSGGAAVAVATGMQAAADGSDMGGSLRFPAAFNNIVGLRPSNGLLPHLAPVNPYGWLSQPGFMARTVADVALLMRLTTGPHPLAPVRAPGLAGSVGDWEACFEPGDVAGVRVGFSTDLGGRVPVDAQVRQVVDSCAEVFVTLGAHLTESCPQLDMAGRLFRLERAFEFGLGYGRLYREHAAKMKASLRANIEAGLGLSGAEHFERVRLRGGLWPGLVEYFDAHDVFVCTTAQVLPFDKELEYPRAVDGQECEDYLAWMDSATLISATGCPAVSVPAGFSESGLPVGLQIVGRPGADALVLRVAAAFEAATGHAASSPGLGLGR